MRLLLLSNSRHEGLGYLEHAQDHVRDVLGPDVRSVLFVPYAAVTFAYDRYVDNVSPVLAGYCGKQVVGIDTVDDPIAAVTAADAIAVGGGNTWKLLATMRGHGLLPHLRARVLAGAPFIGWSAGANVACPTIQTTNDMPITDAGGFDALGLIGWQINPHYLHGNPPGFKGETREERITEYLELNRDVIVTGLREGTLFRVDDEHVRYIGADTVRVFRYGHQPVELDSSADFSFLRTRLRS